MPEYVAPTQDAEFLLHNVLRVSEQNVPGYEDLDPDFSRAILSEAAKLASELYAPCNAAGDTIGCKLENGVVTTPPGFREAHSALIEGGWTGLDLPEEWGGQNLPFLLNVAVSDFLSAANVSLTIYQVLTHGATATILAHGSQEQKATYLPKMVAGNWSGTSRISPGSPPSASWEVPVPLFCYRCSSDGRPGSVLPLSLRRITSGFLPAGRSSDQPGWNLAS